MLNIINIMPKINFLRTVAKMTVACLAIAAVSISCGKDDDNEVTLLSIAVTKQPTIKTYTVGETFDPGGMVVTATYSNNSTSPVTVTADMLTYDFSTVGTKTLTITYNGKTAEVTGITVSVPANVTTITTEAELRELAQKVNGTGGFTENSFEGHTFVLVNDITLTSGDWEPIGRNTATAVDPDGKSFLFEGTFDGNGKVVSNVVIKGSINWPGFFGAVGENGCVKNLGVNIAEFDVTIPYGNTYAGGIAGTNAGTIEKCFATGDVKAGTTWLAHVFVGGLVGSNAGIISKCYATGNVHAFASANVYVGGLAGIIWGSPTILDGKATIMNSYATGNVSVGTCDWTLYMGGLVGDNGYSVTTTIVENCYSTGLVSGAGSNVGGLMGTNRGTVTASYYDSQTSGKSDTGKGEPKTTTEMKSQSTFADWNFSNIWGISAGTNSGYPYLR